MSKYCFFSADALPLVEKYEIKEVIERFADENKKQTYVLQKPLSKSDSTYDYSEAITIFSTGLRPCFVDCGDDEDGFEEYKEDFIDDLSFLSEKFKYREKIGRKKHWVSQFADVKISKFGLDDLKLHAAPEKRIVDLLASLVIGSINDVKKINLEANNLLDTVKSKIILFDTDQTIFVFRPTVGKKFVIQGLAGSGKTELLLHKLKEIYSSDLDARIAFTCFNKILASSMRNRIPDFFDFMRVERQIDWGNKLFCFHSWGSGKDPYSGMYRYICHHYDIAFGNLQTGTFDDLCKRAINDIKKISGERKFAFDYTFVDESQDFSASFIELCELVTEKKVFVAGDVFQNIFRPIDEMVSRSDMVLKKCYRTDPSNLMFSHALGMGLFEEPVLRWLKDGEWDACGYLYKETNGRAIVSRDPLRRFEDIPANFQSTTIHALNNEEIAESLVSIINEIRARHATAQQGDFAIIFVDKANYVYDAISSLTQKIALRLNWKVNISFETKTNDPNKLFISNINNAKGLEFPFVICFAKNLNRNTSFRNALYTMMARSFLESHLVLSQHVDHDTVGRLRQGLDYMFENGHMRLRLPTQEEIERQKELIVLEEQLSIEDIVHRFCAIKGATPRLTAKLVSRINSMVADIEYDEEYINELLSVEYERHRVL